MKRPMSNADLHSRPPAALPERVAETIARVDGTVETVARVDGTVFFRKVPRDERKNDPDIDKPLWEAEVNGHHGYGRTRSEAMQSAYAEAAR